jgi:ParB family chromosome partitioning protein
MGGVLASERAQEGVTISKITDSIFQYIPTEDVRPNRYQPRAEFDDDALDGLAASIRSEGVMQPLVVRRWKEAGLVGKTAQWEIVAGERRWRAALLAGLRQLPCVVQEVDDQQAAEWALVENLQREDLGALELAQAFLQLQKTFGMTQDEIAERVGMHRASVANYLRVLELEAPIQQWLQEGSLSFGHAKVLLGLGAGEDRVRVARRAVRQGLSVRALEQSAARGGGVPGAQKSETVSKTSDSTRDLERRLGEYLGSRVTIRTSSGGSKGSVQIAFYDLDHFESLLQKMGYR